MARPRLHGLAATAALAALAVALLSTVPSARREPRFERAGAANAAPSAPAALPAPAAPQTALACTRAQAGDPKAPQIAATAQVRVTVTAAGASAPRVTVRLRGGRTDRSRITDRDGYALFEGLEPRSYTVTAELTPMLRAEAKVTARPGAAETIDIELPPHGELRGRLLVPPGADTRKLMVEADPDPWPPLTDTSAMFTGSILPAAPLSTRAGFVIRRVPAGPVELRLVLPSREVRDGVGSRTRHANAQVPLGRAMVAPHATTTVELDARDVFPGYAEIRVAGVSTGTDLLLELRKEEAHQAFNLAAGGTPVLVGPLLSGRWSGTIGPIAAWRHAVDLEVPPGGVARADIEIVEVDASLILFDGTTMQPMRRDRVCVRNAHGAFVAETDDRGVLRLRLPRGQYRLYQPGKARLTGENQRVVSWGGALPAALVLPASL